MPLDGVARSAGADRRAALQDPARDRRPEPALPPGRRADQRRRLRPGLVRRRRRARPSTAASRPRGPTRTCASSPRTSSRRSSWRTSARRSARRSSRPTAIRSAAATGCSCTTATSAASTPCGATSCSPIDPALFADVQGSTDTEVVFHLALTFGLEDDPIGALERTVGLIEATARRHGIPTPSRRPSASPTARPCGPSGTRPRDRPRSLFASADVDTIQHLHPDNPRFERLSADDRLIVSEPFSDLPGVWQEIPAGDRRDRAPRRRARAAAVQCTNTLSSTTALPRATAMAADRTASFTPDPRMRAA